MAKNIPYHKFSLPRPDPDSSLSSIIIMIIKNDNNNMSGNHQIVSHRAHRFPILLHIVLQHALTDPELADIISWELSGTAFRINDQHSFVRDVIPQYFPKMQSYKSFQRQLNLYGIKIQPSIDDHLKGPSSPHSRRRNDPDSFDDGEHGCRSK